MTPTELHRRLYRLNLSRLRPASPDDPFAPEADLDARRLEERYLQSERAAVIDRAGTAPAKPEAFEAWFADLRRTGPGQHDALFDWLAADAPRPAMRWFLTQELATEAGFDDLVALTQRRLPSRPKLELARNYWDEMGCGREAAMHGGLLDALVDELALDGGADRARWEALAVCNTLMGLAFNRRWAYHSIGALGAVELTAPDRCRLVKVGLKRLGIGNAARRYYALHEHIDEHHYAQWAEEVLKPLVARDPRVAPWIAEGALMRLRAGERTFMAYREALGFDEQGREGSRPGAAALQGSPASK